VSFLHRKVYTSAAASEEPIFRIRNGVLRLKMMEAER